MIILLTIDDKGGMLFNKRRQSQDRVLREYIISMTKNSHLFMNSYSSKQFSSMGEISNLIVHENFLNKANTGDYCFVENVSIANYLDKVEQIVLFKWNISYPGDFYFDINLASDKWKLIETEDFKGSSHEKITKEIYNHEQN